MGIINVTPDSFSDGGKFKSPADAIKYGIQMFDDGVDFIDIGGESTRPGAANVSINEEMERVIPVIEGIIAQRPQAIISIDTTKHQIAEEALLKGSCIVNDISGGTFDPLILNVAAKYNASYILMHIKGTPQTMQDNPIYENLIEEIKQYFKQRIEEAKQHGVEQIILDPGIGFGKTLAHNFEIIKRLNELKVNNLPLLIGVSRKSLIGKSLNLEVNERDTATSILETIAINKGANIIRTHNYKNALQIKTLIKLAV